MAGINQSIKKINFSGICKKKASIRLNISMPFSLVDIKADEG